MEEWKEIYNAPNYEVSNLGNVRKKQSGEMVHQSTSWDGYKTVSIFYGGEWVTKSVHRLVATAFLGFPENGMQVNHKDGVRNNNKINNLEWVTPSENMIHSFRVLGRQHPRKGKSRKGGESMRINLKLFRVSKKLTQEEFADKINVSRAVYSNIERGRNEANFKFWGNLQKAFDVPDSEMYRLMKTENDEKEKESEREQAESNR